MSISRADLDRVLELEATVPDDGALACLATVAEVLAFEIAQCRAEPDGADECDVVELICRSAGLPPNEVRALERELRPLGYTAVSDRLKAIAGRRKHELKDLETTPDFHNRHSQPVTH